MAALNRPAAALVRVRRGGRVRETPAREFAPGDLVLQGAGSVVPAGNRLVEAGNLRAPEASLTGESLPVDYSPAALAAAEIPLRCAGCVTAGRQLYCAGIAPSSNEPGPSLWPTSFAR